MNTSSQTEINPINLQSIVFQDPDMVSAPMEDELVMISLQRGMYFGLDNIASEIWQRIEKPTRVADLCAWLLEEFEVDPETCTRETLDLLNWLHGQELIKIDPGAN
jgi:hypothetical protein